MASPFDLRFILPIRPLLDGSDLPALFDTLAPYEAPAYLPVDDTGVLPASSLRRFKMIERRKCAELKSLAARFETTDVLHFVVGFMPEDYKAVSVCDEIRRHRVREAVFGLLRSVVSEYKAEEVDSVMALHLQSDFPHVHVAMSRFARSGALRFLINKLPPALFPLN